MKYRIFVFFKEGILDPEAEAIKKTLQTVGFKNVKNLKKGSYFDVEIIGSDTKNEISNLSKDILSNPVIENFDIKKISE